MHGSGGFGKTTLVGQVGRLPEIRARFPGGLLWASVGQRRTGPSLAALIGDLVVRLGGERPAVVAPMQAGRSLATVLDQYPPVLLVLDDVWTDDQLAPFLAGRAANPLLVTTRVTSLLVAGVPRVEVGPMTRDEATALLLHDLPGLPLPDLTALLALTGRWPLLLALANGILSARAVPPARTSPPRPSPSSLSSSPSLSSPPSPAPSSSPSPPPSSPSPSPAPSSSPSPPPSASPSPSFPLFPSAGDAGGSGRPVDLRGAARLLVDQLSADGTALLDPAVPSERQRALDRTVQAALDLLPEPDQRRFLELAIFPEGATIPDQILDLLWSGTGGLSPAASSDLRTALARLNLVEHANGVMRLREVLRAYVRHRLPDAELPQVHRRLVEMARPRSGGPWWALPEADRYLWRHLAHHLREAHWWDELFAVTTDLRRLAIGIPMLGVAAAVADLDRLPDARAGALRARLSQAAPLLRPIRPAGAFADVLLSRLGGSPELAAEVAAFAGEQRSRAGLVARWPLPDVGPDSLCRVIGSAVGWLDCGAVSADGSWFAAAGVSGAVTLVEPRSGAVLGRLTAPAGGVKALVAAGNRLVTGGADGTVRVWDVRRRVVERTLWTAGGEILGVAVAPSGERIAAVGGRGELAVFDSGGRVFGWSGEERLASCVFLSADRVLTASTAGAVTEHDLRTGLSELLVASGAGLPSAASGSGLPSAASGSGLSSSASGAGLSSSASGSRLPSAASGSGLSSADFGGSGVSAAPEPHRSSRDDVLVTAMAVDPAGEWVALGQADGEIRVHELRGDSEPVVLRGHQGWVSALVVSGDRIISGGEDGTVRVWDRYGPEIAMVRAHASWVTSSVLAPDRRTLITTGSDATIRVWDLPRLVQETVAGPIDWVNTCALDPSGTGLATGGRDGVVRLWHPTDATSIPLWSANEPVIRCAFTPDGNWIVAVCASQTAILRGPAPAPSRRPASSAAAPLSDRPAAASQPETGAPVPPPRTRPDTSAPVPSSGFRADTSAAVPPTGFRADTSASVPSPGFRADTSAAVSSPGFRADTSAAVPPSGSRADTSAAASAFGSSAAAPRSGGEVWQGATGCAVAPDQDLVALWDAGGGLEIRSVAGTAFFRREHGRAIQSAAFLPRHRLIVADESGTLTVWHYRSDRTRSVPLHPSPSVSTADPRVRAIQLIANRIVVVHALGVAAFEARSLHPITAAEFAGDPVTHGAISPDGRWLATTSDAGELLIWPSPASPAAPEPIAAMRVDGALFECAWAPDSRDLYAVGQRGVYAFTFRPPRTTPQPSTPPRKRRGRR
ncbi:WD40 repeat domain-containing protein [Actinoplanes oblitus]|uniref:WD40 repeat domain-containing protein n=1 Tax=Actinoplanes oblitus TaxID=3040509 RepID=A0ABY8WMJ7_9ACTN|nr:WD40 repeat domain-containing protein [Actinoplanes oblitus]WIM98707.1 WD40 repeat domain-containing protein [Actinoplanes oblitus]